MANAVDSTELRTRIQNASASDSIINLTAATTYSVTTLGKLTSRNPSPVPFSGYTIQSSQPLTPPAAGGASASFTRKFSNTRIYQQNIDGPYSPGLIKDVELTYTTGTDALLSATTGNFSLSNVRFSGNHSGWANNGNKYLSLTSFNPAAPLNVPLSLTNVSVTISGQAGFNGTTGGSAFLHSWNNNGPVSITNSNFDESGFASTLNLLGTGASPSGSYTITNNSFNRSTDPARRTVRPEGNRLENVNAVLSRNIFTQGSYLDLYGNISGITLGAASTTNTFNVIANGYGIRVTAPNPGAAPTLLGTNVFNVAAGGLPLKYVDATPNTGYALTGGTITVDGTTFSSLIAGGQAGDSISGTANADWINGDDGADNISGGGGNDSILGGAGNDTIEGGAGNDTLNGGIGIDTLSYASSSAAVSVNLGSGATGGDAAGDSISLFENLAGGSNADTLTGNNADNTIFGNSGDDTIDGLAGNDSLLGGAGLDSIIGGAGLDTLDGGDGNDNLNGGDGADHLYGDLGNDTLTGGAANDRFYFNTALNATTNLDTITDFSNSGANTDKIYLSSSIFTGLPIGTPLPVADFGTAPAVGADVVAIGGALYFAAGGAATLAGYTQFATLTTLPVNPISRTDFVVY
jgi:Ca2+-binding RTX toxin-like protein